MRFRDLLPTASSNPADPYTEAVLQAAHRECSSHKTAIEQSRVCGCFHCLRLFPSTEIKQWVRSTADREDLTCALCPHCHVDAVLPSSTVELTEGLLAAMKARWFGRAPIKS